MKRALADTMSKVVISTKNAPAAIGPYSQAIRANGQLWVSGCLGLDKDKTGDFAAQDIEGQTEKVLENMKAILEAGGSSLKQVVKTTILLKDINDFQKVNQVYAKYFKEDPPARATYAVSALPKNALVEIEAIALVDE